MRSLRIISNKIHDNIIRNMEYLGSTPGIFPSSHINAGYLAQILASLDKEKIHEWQLKSEDESPELNRRIYLTAKLCIDGYMRSAEHMIEPYHSGTVWLDACLYMLRYFLTDSSIYKEESKFWRENSVKIFHFIKKSSDIRKISTIDLSRFANSLSMMVKTGIITDDGDFLLESSLELLYRRNKHGFFCFSADDQSTLPLSKQFFILDCLLECRKSIVLEIISREALEAFRNLCSMARRTPTGHFSFRSGEIIAYSAEGIGNIIMGLSALLLVIEDTNQRRATAQMLDGLYCKLLSSRLERGKNSSSDIKSSNPILKNDIATHISESLASLFADRIILNFPEQSIRYRPHHLMNHWQILYLCRCLLNAAKRVNLPY